MKKKIPVLFLAFGVAAALSVRDIVHVAGKGNPMQTPVNQSEMISNEARKKVIESAAIEGNETEIKTGNSSVKEEESNISVPANTVVRKEDSIEKKGKIVASGANILLVNRSNTLDKNYKPETLIVPNVKFISSADPKVKRMDTTAAKALEQMFKAATSDGITLLAVSGYREYSYQQMLYNNKVSAVGRKEADKYVAQPGASEHQTGLAMDVSSNEYEALDEGFENTKAYKWLEKNCSNYGFIIRYPKGKETVTGYNYEPWHLRYVGIKDAKSITEKHITLEEYMNGNA